MIQKNFKFSVIYEKGLCLAPTLSVVRRWPLIIGRIFPFVNGCRHFRDKKLRARSNHVTSDNPSYNHKVTLKVSSMKYLM